MSSPPSSDPKNVVLRPSPDPTAFDSFKIGSARVHRYIRDNSEESASEYVMWYHGRSTSCNEKNIPPLSTGRIGVAHSKNGLHWEKFTEGSDSEDHEGVTLGLNTESWWGFDTAHVGLGQVLLPMSTPAIMTDGGVYLMYYMGGSYEETPISNYLEVPTKKEMMIQGMKMKIGVAVSQDGKTWGRVEGDDPSGACVVPHDESDPNQRLLQKQLQQQQLGPQQKLEEELYCGWPEVVLDDSSIKDDEKSSSSFNMYYSTMIKKDKQKCIARGVSDDGFRWIKQGVCLRPDENEDALDADGCARCNVVKKASYNENGRWVEESGWIMLYEGVSKKDGKHRILKAESDDGATWTKAGLILDVGDGDQWDCNGVGSPHILRLDDGTTRVYYTGVSSDGSTAIGVAKGTSDMKGLFEREQAEFTFIN